MKVPDNKIETITQYVKDQLSGIYSENEINSFIWLAFEHYLGYSKTDLVLKRQERISESDLLKLYFTVKQLKKHKPIQYILGKTEFYGLTFKVNEHVLIPRPETEELVDWIIRDYKSFPDPHIVDIGTGSGCIAIAIKKHKPQARMTGIDISENALEVAKENARLNQVEINTILADLTEPGLSSRIGSCDIIVSNPPYVFESEKGRMEKNVLEYEPHTALFVYDQEPLYFYKKIIEIAHVSLKSGGSLYFEIHERMAQRLSKTLEKTGFGDIEVRKDLSGKERMMKGRKKRRCAQPL